MYKNNLNCRACGHLEESQDHILNQCHKIHTTDQSKIKPEDYFEGDPELLKKAAYKIEKVMTLLESYNTSQASNQNTRRTNRTNNTRGAWSAPEWWWRDGPAIWVNTLEEEEEEEKQSYPAFTAMYSTGGQCGRYTASAFPAHDLELRLDISLCLNFTHSLSSCQWIVIMSHFPCYFLFPGITSHRQYWRLVMIRR